MAYIYLILLGAFAIINLVLWWKLNSVQSQLAAVQEARLRKLDKVSEQLKKRLASSSKDRIKYVEKLDAGGVVTELNELLSDKDNNTTTTLPDPKTPGKA